MDDEQLPPFLKLKRNTVTWPLLALHYNVGWIAQNSSLYNGT